MAVDPRPAQVPTRHDHRGRCKHCYNDTHVDTHGLLVGPTGDTRCIIFDSGDAFLSYAGMHHETLPVIR